MKHKSYLSCITAAVLLAGCAIPTSEGNPAVETAPAAEQSVSASIPQETVAPAYDDGKEYHAELTASADPTDYSQDSNWCYLGLGENKEADCFMLGATVYYAPEGNIALNEDSVRRQQALINRMNGMVSDHCRIYAPAYRQITLDGYVSEKFSDYDALANQDVIDSFRYYLDHYHKAGTPLVLFGFSQGAADCIELLKAFFVGDSSEASQLRNDLVAVYALGHGIEKSFYDEYPELHPAQGSDDIGVIIAFDAETPDVTDSMICHAGTEYVSINPLNWKTDSSRASASENLGAVLVNSKGEIKMEQGEFCGGYLEEGPRHTLKIDDLDYDNFSNPIPYLPVGSYHSYDITFFYRNIQQNVTDRVNAWLQQHSS